jgi:predicted P-loop ATPase
MSNNNQKEANRIQQIKKYLNQYGSFRYNEVNGKLEHKRNDKTDFTELADYNLNSFFVGLGEKNIKCTPSQLKDILTSDFVPRYNPFTKFLEDLPPWDRKRDYIGELASTINTADQNLWANTFKKWLVALVGSMKVDNIINHTVLVLVGRQGLGKSTWLYNLVPDPLKKYCYAGTIKMGDKDTLILLSEKMLIVLDELAYLNGRQVNELKEVITKHDVQLRRAYGRFNETMPRRASFAGSVNDKEFLSDTTGSRRFLTFEVSDIEYGNKVDLTMVYSQALALFNSNEFQYWFDLNEITEIQKNNEQYRINSIEEEYLLMTFEPASKEQKHKCMTTTEILTFFNQMYGVPISNATKLRLGKALKANKFETMTYRNRKAYRLKELDKEKENYLSQASLFQEKQDS